MAFGLAGAFALIVGFGSREMGGELAAGRHLARLVQIGDEIEAGGVTGRIVALHPASVELEVDSGSLHVPNTRLSRADLRVTHS